MKTIELSQKLRHQMEKVLTEERFDHTLGVAYTAASMAFIHGADVQKALTAGMLHDCAKCISHEERLKICRKNEIEVTDIELRNPSLLHAKVGAWLAEHEYEVTDPKILNAIRWHTTGRPAMTTLDKIVFTADFIEPNRKNLQHMDEIRKEAYTDLDVCVRHILHDTLIYLQTIGNECDPMTQQTYDYYKGAF